MICGEGLRDKGYFGYTRKSMGRTKGAVVALPPPRESGEVSVEQALAERRSRREFTQSSLSDEELSQLLWAAQGIVGADGGRTAPSAGGLYPLEIFVVRADGLQRYLPEEHALVEVRDDDLRPILWQEGLQQDVLRDAPCVFLISAVFTRTRAKYSVSAERYVYIEAGHVAQNMLLQATALGLGAVPIGAFDEELSGRLALPDGELPIYFVAVGHRADQPA